MVWIVALVPLGVFVMVRNGLSLDGYEGTGALAILCGGLSFLVSLICAARLVRPIRILQAATAKMANGDLHASAEAHSRDEIELLAEAVNGMARTILGRNQILESVSFAAKQFLSDGARDTIVEEVLQRVGQATDSSRAFVLRMRSAQGDLQPILHQEWLSSASCTSNEGWDSFAWQGTGGDHWVERLKQGEAVIVKPVELETPVRERIDRRIRSTIFVPIMVAGEWWGIAGFDDFIQEREWGEAERHCLQAVADMLGASIAGRQVRTALMDAKETLELRVIERTRELQEQIEAKDRAHMDLAAAQQRLIELSREAGMAEIATGVLHNVGNVLNSVNVSATIAASKIGELRVDKLVATVGMLDQHHDDLAGFLNRDPRGTRVLPYLGKLGKQLEEDRQVSLKELEQLRDHVGHIKQIVATQQSLAKVSGLIEKTSLAGVVEDALRIVAPTLDRHGISLEREFESLTEVYMDKHQVLQILLNLLRNAKESIKEGGDLRKLIHIRIYRHGEDRVRIEVRDSGVGLDRQQLTRIFAHGYTTKRDGHGFGLHSGALAARQMDGSLWAESDGPGRGASFVLELPWGEILERRAG